MAIGNSDHLTLLKSYKVRKEGAQVWERGERRVIVGGILTQYVVMTEPSGEG